MLDHAHHITPEPTVALATAVPYVAPVQPVVSATGGLDAGAGGSRLSGRATHYGEAYNGSPLGCGNGPYSSTDVTIAAVGYSNYARFPCGAPMTICGAGGCIAATRQDACPGCDAAGIIVDLSESGIDAVCGAKGSSSCLVTME